MARAEALKTLNEPSSSRQLLQTLQKEAIRTGQVVSSSNLQYRLNKLIDRQVGQRNLGEEHALSTALKFYLPEDQDLRGK